MSRNIAFATAGLFIAGVMALPEMRVAAATPPCEIDGIDRIVAVGDVHGAYSRLVEILQTAGLIDGRLRWSGGRAQFVQLGDVVDRGPDSLKALDLLRQLEEDAPRAGGAVHVLLGNHEVMRMLGDLRYMVPAEYDPFVTTRSSRTRRDYVNLAPPEQRDQLLKDTPLGLVEMRRAFGRQGNYGKWLRNQNVVLKINGILFVHGGIGPATAALPCNEINRLAQRELTAEEDQTRADPLHTLVASETGPLWNRALAQEPDSFEPQVDAMLAAQHARAIVIGHTVVPEGRIRVRFSGKVLQIDTGMQPEYVAAGRASALEIQKEMFTAIYTDRRDSLVRVPEAVDPGSLVPAVR